MEENNIDDNIQQNQEIADNNQVGNQVPNDYVSRADFEKMRAEIEDFKSQQKLSKKEQNYTPKSKYVEKSEEIADEHMDPEEIEERINYLKEDAVEEYKKNRYEGQKEFIKNSHDYFSGGDANKYNELVQKAVNENIHFVTKSLGQERVQQIFGEFKDVDYNNEYFKRIMLGFNEAIMKYLKNNNDDIFNVIQGMPNNTDNEESILKEIEDPNTSKDKVTELIGKLQQVRNFKRQRQTQF